MIALLEHERAAIFHGDCKDLGEVLPENSIDAIVTDPPAGISFMSRSWDKDHGGRENWIAWMTSLLAPAYRALKPGGHGLIWALPRTSHWTATAIEDVGFEIRDVHHHIFGTGFPKSLTSASADIPEGTGTALKPAVEHWILVRKPLDGTVAENFAEHGTGVLQIAACRVGTTKDVPSSASTVGNAVYGKGMGSLAAGTETSGFDPNVGRWPAHLTLDEHAAEILDAQSGTLKSGTGSVKRASGAGGAKSNSIGRESRPPGTPNIEHRNSLVGGASRFFYVAKGSRAEKDAGLDHLPKKSGGEATGREDDSAGTKNPRAGAGRTGGARNSHPTIKSVALMKWLVKLITPPGGTVLDPFAGSGTTGVAALAEGFSFIGVEQGGEGGEYLPILVGRIRHALGLAQENPTTMDAAP